MKTHVTTTHPEATLGEAVDLMDLYQVPSLPVVDSARQLHGMLHEDDVLRAMQENPGNQPSSNPALNSALDVEQTLGASLVATLLVQDYMTQPALSVPEHCDARHAAQMLLANNLTRLPVTDETGKVVGILNRIDVIQAVFERLL